MDWRWAGPPLDTRPVFPLERDEFVALLRDLEAGDWQQPTVCPGWNVRDLIGHLGPQLDQFWTSLDLNRAGEPVSSTGCTSSKSATPSAARARLTST